MPIALRTNLIFSGAFTVFAAVAPEVLMRIFTSDPALIESGAVYLRAVSLSYLLCGISQIYLILLKKYRLCHGQFTDQLYSGRREYYLQCDLDLRAVWASCVRNTGSGLRDGCRPSGGARLELSGDEAVRACADHLEENVPCGGCRSDKKISGVIPCRCSALHSSGESPTCPTL